MADGVEVHKHAPGGTLAFACATSHGEVHYAYALEPSDARPPQSQGEVFRPVGGAYRVDTAVAGGVALLALPQSRGRSSLVVTFINTTSETANGSCDISYRRNDDEHTLKRFAVTVDPHRSRTVVICFVGT